MLDTETVHLAPPATVHLGDHESCDEDLVGAKAANLARAMRLGLHVLDGFTTVELAARDYGVVIDPETLALDAAATEAARARR